MPRAARIVVPEMAVHVIQRGNNHGRCFFSDADYLAYLSYLRFFARRYQCSIHAYCLMTNHVHLLLTPHAADACALLMKYLSQCYVQRVNKRIGRSGTLWEGRFRSCLVASEHYVLACYRYIELNPVRAGMVSHPAEYPWSSYAANSQGRLDPVIGPHPAYVSLAEKIEHRLLAYGELLDAPLDVRLVEEIRKATRGGYVVGSQRRARGRPARKMGSVPVFEV
jgi:putative transposase